MGLGEWEHVIRTLSGEFAVILQQRVVAVRPALIVGQISLMY